jgi:hypothetical protein
VLVFTSSASLRQHGFASKRTRTASSASVTRSATAGLAPWKTPDSNRTARIDRRPAAARATLEQAARAARPRRTAERRNSESAPQHSHLDRYVGRLAAASGLPRGSRRLFQVSRSSFAGGSRARVERSARGVGETKRPPWCASAATRNRTRGPASHGGGAGHLRQPLDHGRHVPGRPSVRRRGHRPSAG